MDTEEFQDRIKQFSVAVRRATVALNSFEEGWSAGMCAGAATRPMTNDEMHTYQADRVLRERYNTDPPVTRLNVFGEWRGLEALVNGHDCNVEITTRENACTTPDELPHRWTDGGRWVGSNDGRVAWEYATPPNYMRAEAKERARKLLNDNLDPTQRHDYERSGAITAIGNMTGARYVFGAQGSIRSPDIGDKYCLTTESLYSCHVPEDSLLARKLMIECEEGEFLRTANKIAHLEEWYNRII